MMQARKYTPSGGSSSLPGGGMLRPPTGGGAGNQNAFSYGNYSAAPWQQQQPIKPPTYDPVQVNVPQYQAPNQNYVQQAYNQVSNTGGLQGLYDDIFKQTQRLDPYGSGLSSEAATKAMMNTAMGYVMPYAGQMSGQGHQGAMANMQNQFQANYNPAMQAQQLNAQGWNQAQGYNQNAAQQQQQQYQWGTGFNANQGQQAWQNQFAENQANQAQENWQNQFDLQQQYGQGGQGYPGTNFVGGLPDFSFPSGINPGGAGGSVAGSTNPSTPWGGGGGGGWGGGGGYSGSPQTNPWTQPGQNVPSWNNEGGGYLPPPHVSGQGYWGQ